MRAIRPSPPRPGPRPPATEALIGESPGVLAALRTARKVAGSTATVLVQGESGTGKELLARLLHEESGRAHRPFVAVNCAAVLETLLESELFGHERGAFTGALTRRIGRFERASGGTLFLDEVGDMSAAMQAKILRALQEREIERVGGGSAVPVDVRVVAATNHDLGAEVAAGRFREDLFYRLAVVVIRLPPLRERGGDAELLADHFLDRFAAEHGRAVRCFSPEAAALLRAHSWPGNVRELRNVAERAVLVAEGDEVRPEHLPSALREALPLAGAAGDGAGRAAVLPLREVERVHIERALSLTDGNLGHAAELLGIHRNTLREKLRRYDSARAGR